MESVIRSRALILVCFLLVISTLFSLLINPTNAQEESATSTTLDSSVGSTGYTVEKLPNETIFNDFVVGPGKTELVLSPGESAVTELTIANRLGERRVFRFEMEDMTGSKTGAQAVVLLGSERGPYTLKDYIQLPQLEIELEHAERARIPVRVSLPGNAEPGGRYGSVVVSVISKAGGNGSQTGAAPASAIVSRIGALFFVTTPGEVKREGRLADFSTRLNRRVFTDDPVNFNIVYENTGSVHVNPYGEIRISNLLGEEVGLIMLDPWFSLPNSLRLREVTWEREWLFGRYTATLHLNRGYSDLIDTRTVVFWVLPWKIVSLVFGILLLLFLSLRYFFSRFEFRAKRR